MKKNYIFTLLMTLCLTATSFGQYSDLFFSMYAEGSSNNKFIEIYNGTGNDIDLSDYMIKGSNNGGDWKAERDLSLTGTVTAGEVYVISTDQADASILAVADLALSYESALHYNGDDAIGLFKKDSNGDFNLIDIVGVPTVDPGSGWDVAGVTNATSNHTLTRKNSISGPNVDWANSAGTDVSDSEWVVTDSDSEWANLGSYTPSVTDPEGQYSDLFFSMYAEGSSNNKFVEIYNGTGSDVDLSNYMIKGSNNGGDWKAERELTLSSTVIDGDVYVISTDQADASILAVGDLALSYESALHYNGDDAIGLFKKDSNGDFNLIDIIGVPTVDPGSGWDVAGVANATSNHTLTRKNSISGPNVDWANSAGTDVSDSEWVVTDSDSEWGNLGSYTPAGTASVRTNIIQGFATYPNPITNNKFTVLTSSNLEKSVTLFNLLGKKVLSSSFSGVKSDVDVSTISSGIYILKLTEAGKTATKKLVIR